MELKDVVSKIVGNGELKAKLRSLKSFDEVYDFFVANGYEGDENELKEKLFKGFSPFRALTDEDLTGISGGISGRQVLSACMGLMMLTGLTPNVLGTTSYAGAKSAESSATKVVGKQSFGSKIRQKLSRLAEKLGIQVGSKKIKPKSAKELKKEEHEKLLRFADIYCDEYAKAMYGVLANIGYQEIVKESGQGSADLDALSNELEVFAEIERFKSNADIANLETNDDVAEFKATLDKLVDELDYKNLDKKTFDNKQDEILNAHPEYKKYFVYGYDSPFTQSLESDLKSKLTRNEKIKIFRSFKSKLDASENRFSKLFQGNEQYRIVIKAFVAMLFAGEVLGFDVDTRDIDATADSRALIKIMFGKDELNVLRKLAEGGEYSDKFLNSLE